MIRPDRMVVHRRIIEEAHRNQVRSSERRTTMNHTLRLIPMLVIVAIFIGACGTEVPASSDGTGNAEPPSLDAIDGDWLLVDATIDGNDLELNDLYDVTMNVAGSDIGGRAACNSYFGTAEINGNAFSVAGVGQTEMGCEAPIMELESAYVQALVRVSSASRSGDSLQLSGESITMSYKIIPPVPTAELVATNWLLDTLIQGEAASSTSSNAEDAILLLNADGTFVGGTGCRTISGDYVVSGGTLQFTSWGADGECSSELEQQDNDVISVLEDRLSVEINGDRLTLMASGGEGLSYTSQP